MSTRDKLFTLITSIFLISCSTTHVKQTGKAADYNQTTGWFHGGCLAIKNDSIPNETQLTLIQIEDTKQSVIEGTVISKASDSINCAPLIEDRKAINIDSGYSFYLTNLKSELAIGIAILGNLDNQEGYVFSTCNTTEGVSFELQVDAQKVWSGYYYLGYEAEADCID